MASEREGDRVVAAEQQTSKVVETKCPACKGVGTAFNIRPDHSFDIADCAECLGKGVISEEVPDEIKFGVGDYWRSDNGYDYEILQVFKSTLFIKETPHPTYIHEGEKRLINKHLFMEEIYEGTINRLHEPG